MIATNWGWKEVIANNSKILMPHFTDASAIPDDLLKTISCSCETSCVGNRCGCLKHGMRCTDLCIKCTGSGSCLNVEKVSENESDLGDASIEIEEPSLVLNQEQLLEELSDFKEEQVEADLENIRWDDEEEATSAKRAGLV